MKILFFFLLLTLAALNEAYQEKNINAECSFIKVAHDYFYESFYKCKVINFEKIKTDKLKIESVTGVHNKGYSNENVTAFSIYCKKCEISSFPTGIEKIFHNINNIKIDNTKLMQITKNDLKSFHDLTQLWLPRNEITRISQDTFKFNPKLRVIMLYGNQIYHIDPKTFSPLKYLVKLDLAENDCELLGSANDKEDVDALIKQIDDSECIIPDESNEILIT